MTESLIDRVVAHLHANIPAVVAEWYPAGTREGQEWCVGDLRGSKGRSLKINLSTGRWADFAADIKGGDLLSLHAARCNFVGTNPQLQAAKDLAASFGIDDKPGAVTAKKPPPAKKRAVMPVPAGAPKPTCKHPKHGEPSQRWVYRDAKGQLLFVVARYDTETGKEVIPWTYDGERWRQGGLGDNRPLYGLGKLAYSPGAPAIVVEGEKAAAALQRMADASGIPAIAVTWQGGSKAVSKSDWSPLKGRKVLVIADADATGEAAARDVATALGGATVVFIRPKGGGNFPEIPEGWDVADAEADGWDWARLKDFMAGCERVTLGQPEPKSERVADPKPTPEPKPSIDDPVPPLAFVPPADADADYLKQFYTWSDKCIKNKRGDLARSSSQNILAFFRYHPDMRGALAFDMLTKEIVWTRTPDCLKEFAPYRNRSEFVDEDAINIAAHLDRLNVSATKSQCWDAATAVASENAIDPIQRYLRSLEWDGVPRLEKLTSRYFGSEENHYTRAVSVKFAIGAVARALQPGCKMDTMLVLEGKQGTKKSTGVARLFGSAWTTDGLSNVEGKDAQMSLRGFWAVEVAEMHAYSRGEVARWKDFLSKTADDYRPPYGKASVRHLRRCVFVGTVNPDGLGYLRDATGNRRFWPVGCGMVDVEAIEADRDQLWAEAVAMYDAGEPWYLTGEEVALAEKETQKREEVDAWEAQIDQWARAQMTDFTLRDVLQNALGMGQKDWTRPNQTRAGQIMSKLKYPSARRMVGGTRDTYYTAAPAPAQAGWNDTL